MVNRLVGWAGTLVTSVAVAMSLFHLYAAIAGAWPFTDFPIIATQPLRYAHVAFVLVLSFLLFPLSARFRNRIRWWDIAAGIVGAAILVYAIEGGEEFTDRATSPTRLDIVLGVVFIVLLLEATRRTTGWIVPVVALAFIAYAYFGPYLPPPWTHRGFDVGAARRPPVHHARGHLRHPGRRVVLADHPVHDLRRVPAAFRRRQILHRLLDGADGQQGQQRRPHRGAVVVPARRPVRLGRRHHGDDRRRRLSADAEGGLREERRRRPARGRRARRHHLAAGAGRRRLPDRRVPQDQLPRRDLDGDHPDLSLLPVAAVHGRARRQAVRRARGAASSRNCRCGR